MALFNKLDKPIFLKEESELKVYISKLQELYSKAEGSLKYKIEKELKIATMGELGEKNIAYELKNSNMPMYVLHDVTLEIDDLSAQIDYIVVTRKRTFIIECKNLIGNIEIDSQGNFIRTFNFKGRYIKEGIYSPITQNQRHLDVIKRIKKESQSNIIMKMLFEKFFDENYKSIVVLANPKTYLNYKYAKKEVKDKVIRADQLIDFIKKSNATTDLKASNDEDLKRKAESFLKLHRGDKPSFLNKYRELLEEFNSYKSEAIDFNNSMDTSNSRINIKNDANKSSYNKSNSNINSSKSSMTNINGDKNKINKDIYVNIPGNKDVSMDISKNKEISSNINNVNNEELIKKLKAFRLQISRAENTKPYFIFSDKQMMGLINRMPKNKVELKEVSGFGDVKVEKYGDALLRIINE